jgi:hypothetical protein
MHKRYSRHNKCLRIRYFLKIWSTGCATRCDCLDAPLAPPSPLRLCTRLSHCRGYRNFACVWINDNMGIGGLERMITLQCKLALDLPRAELWKRLKTGKTTIFAITTHGVNGKGKYHFWALSLEIWLQLQKVPLFQWHFCRQHSTWYGL